MRAVPVRAAPARVPLAAARAVADEVRRRWRGRAPPVVVGGIRRESPLVKDIDFLVTTPPRIRDGVADFLRPARPGDRLSVAKVVAAGPRRVSVVLRDGGAAGGARHYRADFFVRKPGEKPFALFHFTGARAYNIRVRAHAKKRGLLLNQYGVFDAVTGRRARGSSAIRTERDLARFLRVSFRHPRDRRA